MHNNQDEKTCGCEDHPNISRRLPEEGHVQSQQNLERQQAEQTHRSLCFTEATWALKQYGNGRRRPIPKQFNNQNTKTLISQNK